MTLVHRANHPRGVTLIETIMVIVLLSAAAIASSMMLDRQWVARRSVAAITGEVAQTLGAARNTAITNQATIRVRRLRRRGIEQLVVTELAGPLGPGRTRTVDLGDDVRLRGAPTEVLFTPTGGSNRGLNWTITRSQSTGQVNVSPADGHVTTVFP